MCAANGALPGQGDNTIIFAFAPRNLNVAGLGSCTYSTYAPLGCQIGYASTDIFYVRGSDVSTAAFFAHCLLPCAVLTIHPAYACDM
eukprot:4462939-Prymnesium_polylepis.1